MESARRMTRNFWWLFPILMAMSAVGQDANFGLKVKCYIQDGTVLCPGCNSRAGLSCPRNLKMESCKTKTEIPYTQKETNQTEQYEGGVETTTVTEDLTPNKTTILKPVTPPNNVQQEEIDWTELAKDIEFRAFIYSLLRPYEKSRRYIREVPVQLEDDTCEWNGDCPCPLICCKTGDGCPKRCMSGIRLPPPWG